MSYFHVIIIFGHLLMSCNVTVLIIRNSSNCEINLLWIIILYNYRQIVYNPNKCNHITFTLRKQILPNILLNGTHITQTKQVKYLGLHLDRQLTWKQHTKSVIDKKWTTRRQMHWLTSRKSKLSIENKLKISKLS